MDFKLVSDFAPTGDQPEAIKQLVDGLKRGDHAQTLLGVTGSGKTFTIANVLAQLNRPALVLSHNKTLAAQLYGEFKAFFPENAVEYFVSYYDYYRPEAYIPSTDTYIEKDMSMNDEIDKLRHSATASLGERRDVIVVASVSCIYGLGAPQEYFSQTLDRLTEGGNKEPLLRVLERLASMSCKAAIKGGQTISYSEADHLVAELLTLDNPYQCPHGRPTIISVSEYELEKKFKRIV